VNPLRSFEEFLDDGTVRRQRVDVPRAASLKEESEKRRAFLKEMQQKIGVNDNNANYFVETAYDVLMELARAKLLLDGYISAGAYAHEAEVAYLRMLGFSEADVRFANDLRYFRKGIMYYGKRFDSSYALQVLQFLDKVFPHLKKRVEKV
jgi:hypothetical protein